jgi:hypothetical protein
MASVPDCELFVAPYCNAIDPVVSELLTPYDFPSETVSFLRSECWPPSVPSDLSDKTSMRSNPYSKLLWVRRTWERYVKWYTSSRIIKLHKLYNHVEEHECPDDEDRLRALVASLPVPPTWLAMAQIRRMSVTVAKSSAANRNPVV